jgi:uncharacterized protein (DUF4415 family)
MRKKSKAKIKKNSRNDNPVWTASDFARAKPLREVLPGLVEAVKRSRGRPKLDKPKVQITLRLDSEVLEAWRSLGEGWQTKLNSELRSAARRKKLIAA